jgi:hypothetical protein
MRRTLALAVVFAGLWAVPAGADQPTLKLGNLNLGSQRAGTTIVVYERVTAKQPTLLLGESLGTVGAFSSLSFDPTVDSCYARLGTILEAGESCIAPLTFTFVAGRFTGVFSTSGVDAPIRGLAH